MPDFSSPDNPLKYNPQRAESEGVGSGNTTADVNAGDWTGFFLVGGPRGRITWSDGPFLTLAEVEAAGYIKMDDLPSGITAPYPLDGPQGLARFNDSDSAGIYGIGFATKQPSGVNSSGPVTWFGIEDPSALNPDQALVIASFVAVNGTAIPNTTDIEVGAFPVTTSGGADNLVFTMSETNKVVNVYTDGIGAGAMEGFPAADRNADFRAAGSSPVNWALGVKLSAALPSGCVLDVRCALRSAPY